MDRTKNLKITENQQEQNDYTKFVTDGLHFRIDRIDDQLESDVDNDNNSIFDSDDEHNDTDEDIHSPFLKQKDETYEEWR